MDGIIEFFLLKRMQFYIIYKITSAPLFFFVLGKGLLLDIGPAAGSAAHLPTTAPRAPPPPKKKKIALPPPPPTPSSKCIPQWAVHASRSSASSQTMPWPLIWFGLCASQLGVSRNCSDSDCSLKRQDAKPRPELVSGISRMCCCS
jgi:hypothetical protein